jgi:hypothetical protein
VAFGLALGFSWLGVWHGMIFGLDWFGFWLE